MKQFAKPEEICLYEACSDYQKLQIHPDDPNIIKGVQRFACQTRGKYFVETTGTILPQMHTGTRYSADAGLPGGRH